jgi:hypothetical protein
MQDLHTEHPCPDETGFSYTPLDHRRVHNANVLGAWLLAEVAARTTEANLASASLAAARYTARRQQPDGSWLYGESQGDAWIDNFHTGYVLVALQKIGKALGTVEFADAVERGYTYWKTHFFAPNGAPKYYPHQTYPIDIHSAAQAILTLLAFSDQDPEAQMLADRMAVWAIENMQAPAGYFHYQIHPDYRICIPYMRWSQAWMQRAFAELTWSRQRENLA